jgi:hypothetical protein
VSGPFAIAAVTAVLKDVLNDGLANHDLSSVGNVAVTALPPDRIPVTNADEQSQLNLFMYQVVENQGWHNMGLPSRSSAGDRLTNPPLALDLHYLLTAYGQKEFHSEALLGYAMQLLHETPILTRAMIDATLKPALPPEVTIPPGLHLLSTSDLANQIELIKITPHYLSTEEISRLWSAMQAKYRPTAVYRLSVVLIQQTEPGNSPLPVLKIGEQGGGPIVQANITPPYPTISTVTLPKGQTQALLGDNVALAGSDFAGDTGNPADVTVVVNLIGQRLPNPLLIPVPVASRGPSQISFQVPPTPATLPAGAYAMGVTVFPNGLPDQTQPSNEESFLIAPQITGGLGAPVVRTAVDPVTLLGTATLTLTCSPDVLPQQRISLVVGSRAASPNLFAAQTNSLTFVVTGLPAGDQWVRLRVDGAESLLVDRSDPANPKFDSTQKITLT